MKQQQMIQLQTIVLTTKLPPVLTLTNPKFQLADDDDDEAEEEDDHLPTDRVGFLDEVDEDAFPSGFDSHRGRRSKRSATNDVRASVHSVHPSSKKQEEEEEEEDGAIRIVKEISFGDQVGSNAYETRKE